MPFLHSETFHFWSMYVLVSICFFVGIYLCGMPAICRSGFPGLNGLKDAFKYDSTYKEHRIINGILAIAFLWGYVEISLTLFRS